MRRMIVLLTLVSACLALALGLGSPARSDPGPCPDQFTLVPAEEGFPSGEADHNGNRLVCFKQADGKTGKLHYTDDKL